MSTKSVRDTRRVALVILTLSAAPIEARAEAILIEHVFTTLAPQSIYGPGSPTSIGGSFHGSTYNQSITNGSITGGCLFGICAFFGDEQYAISTGTIGFTVSPRLSTGELTADVPVRIGLGLPDGPIQVGEPFTVSSTYENGPGLHFSAASPQFSLGVDLFVDADIRVGSRSCNFACSTFEPAEPFHVNNLATEVFALNRDFDQELRVFGQRLISDVGNVGVPIPLLTQELTIRDVTRLYTLGRVQLYPLPFTTVTETGNGSGPVSGSASTDLARVTADVTNLIAYGSTLAGVPIPPLNGNFSFGFGYNLLRVDAGIGLGMRNSYSLAPSGATIDLRIDQTGQSFAFEAGQSMDIPFPQGFDEITLTPRITLRPPLFTTDIDFLISPLVDVSALGVTLAFVPITLIDPPAYRLTNFPIQVWNDSFELGGFTGFTGEAIRITAAPQAVPEPATIALVVMALAGHGLRRRSTRR